MIDRLRTLAPSLFIPGPTDKRAKNALRERFPALSGRYAGCDEHSDPFAQGMCTILLQLWQMFGEQLPEAFLDGNRWDDALAEADEQLRGSPGDVQALLEQFPKLRTFLAQHVRTSKVYCDGVLAGFTAGIEILVRAARKAPAHVAAAGAGVDDNVFDDLAAAAADAADTVVPARDALADDAADFELDDAAPTPAAPPPASGDWSHFIAYLAEVTARFQAVPGLLDVQFAAGPTPNTVRLTAYADDNQLDAAALVALGAAARGAAYTIRLSPMTGRLQVLVALSPP